MAVTGMNMPRLGLGCSKMGSFGNPAPLSESISLIRAALDMGVTLLDTANIYGQGDSERAIGRALKGQRDRAFVVTKAGQAFSPKMRMLRPFKPILRPLLARRSGGGAVTARRADVMRVDWSPRALTTSLDGSLRRLRTDRVDAFLLHSPAAEVIARAEIARMLEQALSSGKARAVGVACDDVASLDAALALPQVTVLELPWDVLAAIAGTDRAAAITARGIAVIAREVLVFQPGVPPMDAIGAAIAMPVVTTTLIGSRRMDRVRAIASHFAGQAGDRT